MYYIGIDLGTSSVKLLLMDESGNIQKITTKEYPLYYPQPGWVEQSPKDWWQGTCEGLKELIAEIPASDVAGIGVCGQMHSLVILDEQDQVIRPAILWNDSRTEAEVTYLNEDIGTDVISKRTANIAFAGFTAPKLLWLQKNEPANFAKIKKIMLPKDYINYRLTGAHTCDYSDASGMLLLDVEHKCWSKEMLELCSVTEAQMPALKESFEVIGTVKEEVAQTLGLNLNVQVVAGAGDNAGAAIGTGTIGGGTCNISLGTSGTIFISSKEFLVDDGNGLHAFAHADGGYHLMGCMLSAASCNQWFMDQILACNDYEAFQNGIAKEYLGHNHVYFLPYLMGERSPINDVHARGTFTGLTMDTSREEMLLAVLEGVAFAIRDCFEAAKSTGLVISQSNISGGGAKSKLWKQILANILGIPLDIVETEQGPSYGGAILAAVGCGAYKNVTEACGQIIHVIDRVEPDAELVAAYDTRYQEFSKLYPALKEVFRKVY